MRSLREVVEDHPVVEGAWYRIKTTASLSNRAHRFVPRSLKGPSWRWITLCGRHLGPSVRDVIASSDETVRCPLCVTEVAYLEGC